MSIDLFPQEHNHCKKLDAYGCYTNDTGSTSDSTIALVLSPVVRTFYSCIQGCEEPYILTLADYCFRSNIAVITVSLKI